MADTLEARVAAPLKAFLDPVIALGHFQLQYRLVAPAEAVAEQEGPELIVDFSGPDAGLLLANDGELLRSFEQMSFEALRLGPDDHHRLVFDCQSRRQLRVQELRTLAAMAAERVLRTGLPYEFAPMHSRDRRTVHLALKPHSGIASESEGLGRDRHIVVRSLSAPSTTLARGGRKEYRRL